jgi:hypothetical protein
MEQKGWFPPTFALLCAAHHYYLALGEEVVADDVLLAVSHPEELRACAVREGSRE